jgi:hypothetical protein
MESTQLALTTSRLPSLLGADSRIQAQAEGCSSIDLCGRKLTAQDQELFKGSLTVTLGGLSREDAAKAMILWQHIMDKGWSRERMEIALYRFAESKLYGRGWSLGDFFECAPENDLNDQQWYHALDDSEREKVECWLTPEKRMLYRYRGSGVTLPKEFERVWPKA